ncbi:MAG: PAS domain S-box protein [Fibrobacteres bacterium]|nr:PAS domain S-box protein [Fibrobacterota bacterium]
MNNSKKGQDIILSDISLDLLAQEVERFHSLFEKAPLGYQSLDIDGVFLEVNHAWLDTLGYKREEVIGKWFGDFLAPEYVQAFKERFPIFKAQGKIHSEFFMLHKDGSRRYIVFDGRIGHNTDGTFKQTHCILKDETERKLAENYRDAGREILQILNESGDLKKSINDVLSVLKTTTGADAVGLRLQDGNDFPYFVHDGFSNDFLLAENTLVERAKDGGVCRDKDGNINLECTCGLVISGKTDPSNALFTKGGSCWINDSFPLLDLPPDQDPRLHPRNNCIHQGYASVALIPIRTKNEIVGLIQLNDKRKGRFSLKTVEILEDIAVHIGSAMMRKRAEEELRKSEETYRALVDGLPDIVMRFDREGRHLYVSDNVNTVVELQAAQFIGKTHKELGFPIEMCKSWEESIRRTYESGKPIEKEFSFDSKRGHTTFNWRLLPEFDKDGNIISVLSISRDISKQKRDEHQLRQNQYYLKKAQQIGKIGHFSFDPITNIVEGSDELLRIFDVDSGSSIPLFDAFANAVYPEDGHLIFPFIDRAIKEGIPYDVEHRVRHRNGTILHVNAKGGIADTPDGRRMVGTVQDITDWKRMEATLNNIQKLESLGLLAGGIAHDFNNIMGGIFGYIDMANVSTKEPKVNSYLSKAMNTIERARDLTQQLLTFAKGGDPHQEIGQLFPFIEETARFALSGANVSCKFDIQPDLWVCNFDKNQIGQVIDNLIINAQQAMPVGGTINLTARNMSLSENEHPSLKTGEYVKISIKDSGIGIPKELITKIFDPFFTTKAKGHGLGLATCYSIINRHGGCIDVESEQGKGSTFKIYLPAAPGAALAAVRLLDKNHNGSGTFLIMDDEEVMRDIIGDMLVSLGYTVISKENGKEAVEFLLTETNANRTITGLIFDLTVPGGMGGKAAIEEIRKTNKSIPAFVASGYADDPVMKNPTEYGFMASICKPFRKSELSEMLNKHMKPKEE